MTVSREVKAQLSDDRGAAGTMIMFEATPYAHLHICGNPWEGNEYRSDVDAVWTMVFQRPRD